MTVGVRARMGARVRVKGEARARMGAGIRVKGEARARMGVRVWVGVGVCVCVRTDLEYALGDLMLGHLRLASTVAPDRGPALRR